MAELSENKKFINLEGVRVSYRKSDDSIHITSTDLDLIDGLHLTIKEGSQAERSLRAMLKELGLISVEPVTKPELPTLVELPDAQKENQWDLIRLGVGDKSAEILWDVTRVPHMLIAGRAGTGKTTFTQNIIQHCANFNNEWDIYGIEAKSNTFGSLSGSMKEVASTQMDATLLIEKLKDEVEETYRAMKKENVLSFRHLSTPKKSTLIAIDQMTNFTETNPSKTEEEDFMARRFNLMIRRIVQFGRAAGYHIVGNSQNILNLHAVDFGVRVGMGRMDAVQSGAILANGDGTRTENIKGRGVISMEGQENRPFQSYIYYLPQSE